MTVMQMPGQFQPEQFAEFHPAGVLGRSLLKVEEAMLVSRDSRVHVVHDMLTLGQCWKRAKRPPVASGPCCWWTARAGSAGSSPTRICDACWSSTAADILDRPVAEFMIRNPKHDLANWPTCAEAMMNQHRIDELPVLDDESRPVGIIDVQDLLESKR